MKAEAFYTGGGIWLAEKQLENGNYAVVSSNFLDCLTVYTKNVDYFPEDMVFSKSVHDLDSDLMEVYNELVAELKKNI